MVKKAKLGEFASRLSGFGTAWFSVQWTPPVIQRDVAKRVIALLEDKRVLYVDYSWEMPGDCVQSVLDLRRFLTEEIMKLEPGSEIADSLRALRAACVKFLTALAPNGRHIHRMHGDDREFLMALGELRGVFGIHIAIIADRFGVPVQGELAAMLPLADDPNEKYPLNDLRRPRP